MLELLTQLRRLLEARQRHKRAADSRGTSTQMAEVFRCLLQILNRHEQCPDAQEAAVTKRNMQAEDLWELPIRYEMSENISKYYKLYIFQHATRFDISIPCVYQYDTKHLETEIENANNKNVSSVR